MSRLLIHHVDLDGISIPVVAWSLGLGPHFDQIEDHDYDFDLKEGEIDRLAQFDEVIIADLSINKDSYDQLVARGCRVRIFDHHVSDVTEWIRSADGCVLDNERCGTRLFFEEYAIKLVRRFSPMVREYVSLVDIYDRWQDGHPRWDEAVSLNRVLYRYANFDMKDKAMEMHKEFIQIQLNKIRSGNREWYWTQVERQMIESSREMEWVRYKQAKDTIQLRLDRQGRQFGVFSLPGKISLVCSMLFRQGGYDFLDYLVVANTYGSRVGTPNGKISVRSHGGFDCTTLAICDGHKEAAGGELGKDKAIELLSNPVLAPAYKGDEDADQLLVEAEQ